MQWLLPALCALSLSFSSALFAADQPSGPLPETATVVEKVLARDELQQVDLERYEYRQRVRTEKLGDHDVVKSLSEIEMIVRPGQENDFTIVADGSGGVLSPDQVSEHQRRAARDSEKLKQSFSLRHLAPRFNVRVAGQELCDGKAAYVLAFSPKEDQPARNNVEKVLNHLQGRMWIAQADYSILKTEATLAEPVNLAWFFATMDSLRFSYQAVPIPSGYGPGSFQLTYHIDVVTRKIAQRQTITVDDYKLR